MMLYKQLFIILCSLSNYGVLGENTPSGSLSSNENTTPMTDSSDSSVSLDPDQSDITSTVSATTAVPKLSTESTSSPPSDGAKTSTQGSHTKSTTTESNDASSTKSTTAPSLLPGNNGTSWNNNTTPPATITPPPGNNESSPYFDDISTFAEGFNSWIINGMWGRYNISTKFTLFDIKAPTSPDSDGIIILTMDVNYPFLTKRFPALRNVSLYISSFFTCSEARIVGNSFVDNVRPREIFRIENPMTSKWIAESHLIENEGQPFTINFEYKTQDPKCIWAIDVIRVSGDIIKDKNPVLPSPATTEIPIETTPIPLPIPTTETSSTSPSSTETLPATSSETSSPSTSLPVSTTPMTTPSKSSEPPHPPLTTPDSDNIHQETAKEMGRIASTMWTAIYIFLVLFCLCLLVFIFFAVEKWRKEQREEQTSNPSVSTYSPRSSTYQLGKMRDNPAYETDSV